MKLIRQFISWACLNLALAACSQTADVTFYTDGTWEAQSQIAYNPALFDALGQFLPELSRELELPVEFPQDLTMLDEAGISAGLVALVAWYGSEGIDARWRQAERSSKEASYLLVVAGRDFAQFEKLIPDAITLVEELPGQYHLRVVIGEANALAGAVFKQTITLHAGKIITSNAVQQQGGTAVWRNPSEIDVVFTPADPFSRYLPWVAGCGALLLIGGAAAVVVIISRRPPVSRGRYPLPPRPPTRRQ